MEADIGNPGSDEVDPFEGVEDQFAGSGLWIGRSCDVNTAELVDGDRRRVDGCAGNVASDAFEVVGIGSVVSPRVVVVRRGLECSFGEKNGARAQEIKSEPRGNHAVSGLPPRPRPESKQARQTPRYRSTGSSQCFRRTERPLHRRRRK